MTKQEIIAALIAKPSTDSPEFFSMLDAIDTLTDQERIDVRQEASKQGAREFPRSLYFNYNTQKWVGPDEA